MVLFLGHQYYLVMRVFFWHQDPLLRDFYNPLGISYAFEVELVIIFHVIMYATIFGWHNFDWFLTLFMLHTFLNLIAFSTVEMVLYLVYFLEKITCIKFHYSYNYKKRNVVVDCIAFRAPSICMVTW